MVFSRRQYSQRERRIRSETSRSMPHLSSNCILKKDTSSFTVTNPASGDGKGSLLSGRMSPQIRVDATRNATLAHFVPPLHRGPAILQQKTSGFRVVESSPDGEHLMMLRRCKLPFGQGRRYGADRKTHLTLSASFGAPSI